MKEQMLFEKYYKGKHWTTHKVSYSKQFSEFLRKHKFKGLLIDVGCGEGKDVSTFLNQGFDVMGIDNNEEEIKIAKSNYPGCNFELQDVEDLKFDNNSASAFFVINLIHFTDMKKTIKEIYRVLKKGGYLFIHFNISIIDCDGNIDYKHNEKEILELVSNFEIVVKRIIKRVDEEPIKHTHKIMELILRKI